MMAWVSRRFDAWWQARHVPTDIWTLTQRNIYIVPTRVGFAFAATLLILLVASINYQLNLGFLLTFLLAGSGLVSMEITHRVLRGLTLQLRPPEPAFAGESAVLEIVLTGSGGGARYGIGLRVRSDGAPRRAAPSEFPPRATKGPLRGPWGGRGTPRPGGGHDGEAAWSWADVPSGARVSARVSFVPRVRGLHALPTLMAETRFPFGLFRAWTLWRPASRVLVYPAPEQPAAPLPAALAVPALSSDRHRSSSGEFEGVRAWQRGDALRRVVWKKFARSGELVSRDTHAATRQQLWFDYAHARLPTPEQRLSRLAAWVLAAERAGAEWGLRLPGVDIAPGHGEPHRRAGLEALALWS
jgi:uncharacterized protein (DUF58 family)